MNTPIKMKETIFYYARIIFEFIISIVLSYFIAQWAFDEHYHLFTEKNISISNLDKLAYSFKILSIFLLFITPTIEYNFWGFGRKMKNQHRIISILMGFIFVIAIIFLVSQLFSPKSFTLLFCNWFLSIISISYLLFLLYVDLELLKNYKIERDPINAKIHANLAKYGEGCVLISLIISLTIYLYYMYANFNFSFKIEISNNINIRYTELFFDGALVFQIIISTVIFYFITFNKRKAIAFKNRFNSNS